VESAALLREVLQEAVGEVLSSEASESELLSRFTGVYVQDGTHYSRTSFRRGGGKREGCAQVFNAGSDTIGTVPRLALTEPS